MPLGALLWAAPSRGQHITGARRDRVVVSGLRDGEFALCFDRVDDTAILREGLGIERDQKCCDGIIFYAYQQTRVICLVEMKHTNFKEAINQIGVVRNSLYSMWQEECARYKNIDAIKKLFKDAIWRAYVYQSSATDKHEKEQCLTGLCKLFGKGNIDVSREDDITNFLRYGAMPKKQQEIRKRR